MDLLLHLRDLIAQEDSLILCIDANKNMSHGKFSESLRKLGLVDAVSARHPSLSPPSTWNRGKRQIDAIWVTKDLIPSQSCFLPFGMGIGDHQGIVIDLPNSVLLGEQFPKMAKFSARKLTAQPEVRKRYISSLHNFIVRHKLLQKAYEVYKYASFPLSSELGEKLEKIDRIKKEGMIHAENTCRKIFAGNVPYSPSVVLLGKQLQVWNLVLSFKKGKPISRSLIKRKARACDIESPLSVSLADAEKAFNIAKQKLEKIKPRAASLRSQFLYQQLTKYQTSGYYKHSSAIRTIIHCETVSRSWKFIKHAVGTNKSNNVSQVDTYDKGGWIRQKDKDSIESGIMNENS